MLLATGGRGVDEGPAVAVGEPNGVRWRSPVGRPGGSPLASRFMCGIACGAFLRKGMCSRRRHAHMSFTIVGGGARAVGRAAAAAVWTVVGPLTAVGFHGGQR
nr:hypothetical protein GCM10010200_101540 [Actinomadura rugatobispora]